MLQIGQRQLGASGIIVPPLGVGIWSWGDKGFWGYGNSHNREDIDQAYKVCLDAGLNFFDTAEVYGRGASERLLGECMRQEGRPIIIASKFAPLPNRFSARTLIDALDNTLKRLGVEKIDLYQIHWPYTFVSKDALMDALAEVVHAGKVRAVGVSNFSADDMRKAHARLARHDIPLASNQVHYSLLHRKPEVNGVLEACRALNVALIAYSPLEQGLLTGKFREGSSKLAQLPLLRRVLGRLSSDRLKKIEPLLQTLEEVGKVHEKTIGQTALNWLITRDEHIIPIPGAKNAHQARENAASIGWNLSEDELQRISIAAQSF